MVAMNWTQPLYKITCASEKMIPLNTSFSELLSKAQCRAGDCFYLQESLSQTEMSLEFGHLQPQLWLSLSFICHILQWLLNGYPCHIYCPCGHQGYHIEKCIRSCHFLVQQPLLVSFLLRCSLFGLNTSRVLVYLPAYIPDSPAPVNVLLMPQDV